jgi:hypothetical protein
MCQEFLFEGQFKKNRPISFVDHPPNKLVTGLTCFHVIGGIFRFLSALRKARNNTLLAASSLAKWR